MKLKKGDNIIVIAGKDKGSKGTIAQVIRETGRVIVGGVNKSKRHLKPKSRDQKGTIIEKELSIHASNVMIVDPKSGAQTRLGKKAIDGKMVRVTRKSGSELK